MALSVPVPTRRVLAAASAALLALLTVFAVVASPAQAAPRTTDDPAAAAAGWLARQFVDGDHLETVSDGQSFTDAGLTLDAVLGFAAAGVAGDTAEAAMAWVGEPANLETYVGNGTTDSFAGALAKLSLTAQVQGLDPTAFGPGRVDLLTRLRALITASGRFSDKSSFGDFSNGFSQSYAVLTLARAGSVPPTAVSVPGRVRLPGRRLPAALRPGLLHVRPGHHGAGRAGADGRGRRHGRDRRHPVAGRRPAAGRLVRRRRQQHGPQHEQHRTGRPGAAGGRFDRGRRSGGRVHPQPAGRVHGAGRGRAAGSPSTAPGSSRRPRRGPRRRPCSGCPARGC